MTDIHPITQLQEEAPGGTPPLADLLGHRETVFLICLGYSRNYAEAEDLTQEAYLRACRSWAGLREPGQARVWLCRIARNVCLDHRKSAAVRTRLLRRLAWELETSSPPISPGEDLEVRISRLKAASLALPKKLRDVFVLREYGRLTYEELAEALGIRKGTVMSRLNRARARIGAALVEKSHVGR